MSGLNGAFNKPATNNCLYVNDKQRLLLTVTCAITMHGNKANDRSVKLCTPLSTKVGRQPFNLSAFLHSNACYTSQDA